jgi:hypothetical protein
MCNINTAAESNRALIGLRLSEKIRYEDILIIVDVTDLDSVMEAKIDKLCA